MNSVTCALYQSFQFSQLCYAAMSNASLGFKDWFHFRSIVLHVPTKHTLIFELEHLFPTFQRWAKFNPEQARRRSGGCFSRPFSCPNFLTSWFCWIHLKEFDRIFLSCSRFITFLIDFGTSKILRIKDKFCPIVSRFFTHIRIAIT